MECGEPWGAGGRWFACSWGWGGLVVISEGVILRALCCGVNACRCPEACSVGEGRRPRNLLVWVDDAVPALRRVMETQKEAASAD